MLDGWLLMKLNKIHLSNVGLVSDMVKEIFPDMCRSLNITNKIVENFYDYNTSFHLKVVYTLYDIKVDVGYFRNVEEGFLKLKRKIS